MLVSYLLNPTKDDFVLDLCAAPGGKTIQTALKMNNEGMIIANDLSKSRTNILLSNIERLGIRNTIVTSLDFSKQSNKFQNYFDKIILDAPCSGSGMFRKSDGMKLDWTYEKVLKNAEIQKELILMCYNMLKKGGTLIYSTCSYSFEEDEEVIEHLLKNTDAILIPVPSFLGEYRSKKYPETVHLFPNLFEGEGHYISLIKKPGEILKSKLNSCKILRTSSTRGGIKETNEFIMPSTLPHNFEDLCIRPGLFTTTKIGNKQIMSHHYSHVLDSSGSIELTKEELIKYLKGETINKKYQDGFYPVSYLGMNIGVVHSLNGTLKNLYPKGLRINADIASSF